MAKPSAVYPQVEATARALVNTRLVACPSRSRVSAALTRAARMRADAVVLGRGRVARRRDLERAVGWRLGALRATLLARSGLPTVATDAPEVNVRRLLQQGAPLVMVRDARHALAAIDGERVALARPTLSVAHRLGRVEPATLRVLRAAGRLGDRLDASVFAVGGFVRDVLLDRVPNDVDLLVEGDGIAFARRLSEELGGTLTVHPDFGTASLDGVKDAGGNALGRIDIASARRERYGAPGALPVVSEATVDEDLQRRDFTVNAMAMALRPSAFGRVLDSLGGRADVTCRRLRTLGPLSFVEDPTRIFRAARYAARLGFRLDSSARRALRLALEVGPYPSLSGDRLCAEIELLASEPAGWRGFERLLTWDALTLWDKGYCGRSSGRTVLRAAARVCTWAGEAETSVPASDVALVALLVGQRGPVILRCLDRLGLRGNRRATVLVGVRAQSLSHRLDRPALRRRSDVAELLRPRPRLELIGAWLVGGRRARRHIRWFLTRGRFVRPLLSGDEVMSIGVGRGPAVGACLDALRRGRLDGALETPDEERAFVRAWIARRQSAGGAPPIARAPGRNRHGRTILEAKERCV
jgi:tRNA nucleotidyltransferase (CCA-adding enzyme)